MNPVVLSADAKLLDRWRQGADGVVFGLYSKALYLRDSQGQICCLTTCEQDDGPYTARLNLESFAAVSDGGLVSGMKFVLQENELLIGSFSCDWSSPNTWDMVLPAFPAESLLQQALPILQQELINEGKRGGLASLFHGLPENDVIAAQLSARADALLTALRQNQPELAEKAGRSLLGLGLGLTPSGDDFLAALITLFHVPNTPFPLVYQQIGDNWARKAEQATTPVSAFMLKIAASGRARASVCRLLAALATETKPAVIHEARRVLAFGSLSGTDWLAGLAAGLESGLRLRRYVEEEDNRGREHFD